jgi:glycosyl transferase family 25
VKVFAINMKDNAKRRDHIIGECAKHSLNVEIIDAVAGKELSEAELREAVFDYGSSGFTKGEIGCALSHLKIYRKIVDEGIDIALILEDDAVFSNNINSAVNDIEAYNKKARKPMLFLLTKVEKYISSLPKRLEHINLYRFHKGWLATGYAINRKGAVILLQHLYPMKVVADHWLYIKFYTALTICCVVPHIADSTEELHSALETERLKMDKDKRGSYHKKILYMDMLSFIKWRLYRIFVRPFFRVKENE